MTQQSLITRLKAVEEALDTLNRNRKWCDCEECRKADTALSDLRELIKEAEEQETILSTKEPYKTYTALGEKP